MENWRKRFIVIVGFAESLLFSGCLFGWASLVHVLQHEGIYSHLCHQGEAGLKSVQIENETNLIYDEQSTLDGLTHSSTNSYKYKSTPEWFYDSTTFSPTWSDDLANFMENDDFGILQEKFKETTKEVVTCTAQDKEFTLVYTVAAVMYGLTAVLIGFSLDHLGLWVTRISASVMASAGFFCLAFATPESSWLLWPALILLALGTNQLRLSSFQFANLYPQQRSTIILLYGAAYSISTVMFLIVQYGYEAGVSYQTAIIVLGGISVMTLPVTFLMPTMRIEDEEVQDKNSTIIVEQNLTDPEKLKSSEEWSPSIEKPSEVSQKRPIPLGASFWTLSSLLHFYWQFINSFLVLFYSASFNAWARKTTTEINEVAFYNKMMGLCQLTAPIFIPIAGLATDFLIRRSSRHEDKVERLAVTLEAPAYTLILATTTSAAMLTCKMFLTREAIYVSLVLIAMSRPLLVGSVTSYLRIRFHAEHFNRLNGIHSTLVSIVCLVQYPLFVWMYSSEQSFFAAHLLLMGLLIISFSSPVHLLFRPLSRKYARVLLSQKLESEK